MTHFQAKTFSTKIFLNFPNKQLQNVDKICVKNKFKNSSKVKKL